MRFVTIRKWLLLIGTGVCLFGSSGCPTGQDLRDTVTTSAESLLVNVLDLYVEAVVGSVIGG